MKEVIHLLIIYVYIIGVILAWIYVENWKLVSRSDKFLLGLLWPIFLLFNLLLLFFDPY